MTFFADILPAAAASSAFAATAAEAGLSATALTAAGMGASAATPIVTGAGLAASKPLLTLGDILIAGSGGVGAMASFQAAESASMANAFNAAQLDRGADRTKAIAEMEAASYRKNQLSRLASARTGLNASGRDMTGTAIRLDDQAVEDIAYEEAIIKAGGHLAGQELSEQASLQRASGSYASRAGLIRAGTTLASAGGRMSALQSNFFG